MDRRLKIEIYSRLEQTGIIVLFTLCVLASITFLLAGLTASGHRPQLGFSVVLPMMVAALSVLAAGRWWQPIAWPAECGICRSCGYKMTGHPSNTTRCPECGHPPNLSSDQDWRITTLRAFPAFLLFPWAIICFLFALVYLTLYMGGAIGGR